MMGSVTQRLTDAFFESVRERIEAGPIEADACSGSVPFRSTRPRAKILGHNVSGVRGRDGAAQGPTRSRPRDIEVLEALGRSVVYVAALGATTSRRTRPRVAWPKPPRSGAAAGRERGRARQRRGRRDGRVAARRGALTRVNEVEGVSFATLAGARCRPAGPARATVKIIPYAVAEEALEACEAAASEGGPVLRVDPLPARRVALILTGSASARERIERDFDARSAAGSTRSARRSRRSIRDARGRVRARRRSPTRWRDWSPAESS